MIARALPGPAAWLLGQLWDRPRRYAPPDREHALLAGGTPLPLGFGTDTLPGWSWGAGPPVLLVHGWEGRGAQLGAFVQPLVAAGHRVVAFDAPAHGRSAGGRASLFSFADAVGAAARRVGPLHGIVAHSMGGAAALLALQSGLPVQRLVLVSPVDPVSVPGRFFQAAGIDAPEVLERLGAALSLRYGEPLSAVSSPKMAGTLTAPLLVVHDRSDRLVPWHEGAGIAAAARDARLFTTEGLGHHRILRDAAVVAEVTSFVTGGSP